VWCLAEVPSPARPTPLEALIADAVLARLDSPELFAGLTRTDDGARVSATGDEIAKVQARMNDAAAMFADGEISREEWKEVRDRLEAHMEAHRKDLARMTRRDALEDYVGKGVSLREQWDTLTLAKQVPIIKALVEHVIITPAQPDARQKFDPRRVHPVWRL